MFLLKAILFRIIVHFLNFSFNYVYLFFAFNYVHFFFNIHDTLLIQPAKVFLFALLYAFASKVTVYEEKYVLYIQGKTLAHNESMLHSSMNEEITSNQINTSTVPPTKSSIKIMKAARLLQLKLYLTAWELLLYCLFSIVVFYLGYMSKEKSSYFQTRDVEELFNLKLRTTTNVYKNFQVLERM
ncbi:uncharacterized protein LOC136082217 [Hydra vulgaris]|uniref:Uncharacterized protein LOC136082217 n=1 Tax=Hydra vulgaris TaxID=6087 RepID=A0ABM4C5F1_HYDVU